MDVKTAGRLLDRPLVHVVLIAAVGLLVYANTFNAPLRWDDRAMVRDNQIVHYMKENDTEAARREFEAALMIDPSMAQARRSLDFVNRQSR